MRLEGCRERIPGDPMPQRARGRRPSSRVSETKAYKERRVAVGGDSMLAGIEAPVSHEHSHGLTRDIVSRIRDVTKGLPMIVPSGTMKKACLTLKPWEGNNFGAMIVFSSILPLFREGKERERKILWVNTYP